MVTIIVAVTVLVASALGSASAFAQAGDPTIVVHAGGIRVNNTTTVAPLPNGAVFTAFTPGGFSAGTCTMTAGVCNISVASGSRYAVRETSPPTTTVPTPQGNLGWYLNPTLNTGSGGSVATARTYQFRTPVLTDNQTFNLPGAAGATANATWNPNGEYTDTPFPGATNEQTNPPGQTFSGLLATSLDDPVAPDVCGLKIAIVLDQSTSMNQPRQTAMKNAALATISALDGTPSQLSIYTYGTQANNFGSVLSQPTNTSTGITNLRNFVNGLPTPAVPAGQFTNFDGGLAQVLAGSYNLVVFMTDGNPTNSRIRSPSGVNTFFTDVEQGIFTANEIKSLGTRIIGVGLELGASGGEQNLRAVSGPVQNQDWFSGTNATFVNQLREAAAGSCLNKLIIEKQILDANGNLIIPNPTDANGWTFTTSISPTTPPSTIAQPPPTAPSPETGVNGFTEAAVSIPATATPRVTVTETPLMAGYTFVTATCTVNGVAAPNVILLTPSRQVSFTAAPNAVLQCTFQNRRQAVTPEIKTTQTPSPTLTGQPGTVPVGGTTTDSATVTAPSSPPGLPPPTGSVIFRLYGPQTGTTPVCNSGNLRFTSGGFSVGSDGVAGPASTTAPSPPGTYEWVATFTPSGTNAAHFTTVASVCGAEPIEVVRATPTITTPATAAPVTAGTPLAPDTATLSGGAPPYTGTPPDSGTVTFRLFPPSNTTCTGPPFDEQTVPVTDDTASTTLPFIPNQAGTWHWLAIYNGNADNASVDSGCTAEPRVVDRATPGFSTDQSGGGDLTSPPSTEVFDTATVTPAPGVLPPTGSVTFTLYPDNGCIAGTQVFGPVGVPLNGHLTVESPPFIPINAGTYQWVASFTSGDGNYTNAGPTACGAEPVTIGPNQPDKVTTVQSADVSLGNSVTDEATVTGGSSPTGSVVFTLYGPQASPTTPDCTTNLVFTSAPIPLTGTPPSATSFPPFTPAAAGLYQWVASYLGDANNLPTSSLCGEEPVVITPATPGVTTVTSPPPPVVVGTPLSDSATVSGPAGPPTFPSPTGTVTFELFGPQAGSTPSCTLTNRVFGPATVPLTPGTPPTANAAVPPPGVTLTVAGTYQWVATYDPAGDTNYVAADSGCGNEPVTLERATPGITTTQTPAPPDTAVVGSTIGDSATVSAPATPPGLPIPTGTVTFRLFPDDTCTAGTAVFTSPATTLEGGTASISTNELFPPGTYFWQVTYDPTGDPTFGTVTSGCTAEPVIVTQAKPIIETEPVVANPAGDPIGSAIGDTAIVSGGFNPTGTVSFALFGPGDTECTTNLVAGNPAFQSIPLVNGTATAPTFPTDAVGTYRWVATYNGDTNNQVVDSGCEAEPVIIVQATPDVRTLQSDDGPVGTVMSDTATVTGGFNPSGTVTFELFAPGDTLCETPIATFANVPLSGSPLTAASGPHTSTEAGIYRWLVTYNGDDFNMSNDSGCQEEEMVITEVPPPSPTPQLPSVPGLPSTGYGGASAPEHGTGGSASR